MVEFGFSWLVPMLWRMDKEWQSFRFEVPWVKRAPSAYALKHIPGGEALGGITGKRLVTYAVEASPDGVFVRGQGPRAAGPRLGWAPDSDRLPVVRPLVAEPRLADAIGR